jgi:type I restriction enzyme S subunit
MAGKYQAYPQYIHSRIGWLGQVPEHWERTTFKHLLEMMVDNRGRTPPTYEHGIPLLEAKQIDGTLKYTNTNFDKYIDKKGHAGFIRDDIKENDILFITVGTIGKTCLVPSSPNFVIAQNIVALRTASHCSPMFLLFWLRSMAARESMLATNKDSILDSIKISDFVQSRLYLPELSEQEKIANFLDHETSKIDILIEKQQQLIKLLKEKRQAVISHAVTKGLNPNAPMCDSGVEWLGEVPEHWAVAQLKFNTLQMQTGPFGSQLHAEDYVIGGVPLINPAHMIEGNLSPDPKVTVDDETQERLKRHKLSEGEIIFARRGELGRCAIVTKEQNGWLCGTGSLKAKLNKKLIPEYAYLLITSDGVVSELSLESKGSTMDNLNTETLGRVRMPVPPENEQNQILEYVENISGKYKYLINSAVKAINLIHERRTALISAAVTGKIDVRNWQAPKSSSQGTINDG